MSWLVNNDIPWSASVLWLALVAYGGKGTSFDIVRLSVLMRLFQSQSISVQSFARKILFQSWSKNSNSSTPKNYNDWTLTNAINSIELCLRYPRLHGMVILNLKLQMLVSSRPNPSTSAWRSFHAFATFDKLSTASPGRSMKMTSIATWTYRWGPYIIYYRH